MVSYGSEGGFTDKHLQEAAGDFELCARRAIECILGSPTFSPRKFRLSSHQVGDASMTCFIRAGNAAYSASISLGLDKSDFGKLMPDTPPEELADAIGEVTNVIAGTFMGRPAFSKWFGSMLPSPPDFTGDAEAQEASRLCGLLTANGAKLFLSFAIKSNKKDIHA